jgi:hypothetical protein
MQAQETEKATAGAAQTQQTRIRKRESERKCGTCTTQLNTTEQKRSVHAKLKQEHNQNPKQKRSAPATNLNLRSQ